MSLIKKKFLSTGAVANLLNNVFTTARNAANNADIDLYKLNASNELEFNRGLIPSGNATENIGKPANTWGVAYVASLKNSTDNMIFDISNSTIHTASGSASVDGDNRQLRDSSATNALTWEGANMTAGKPLDMGGNAIKGVGSPSISTDAATKGYVDSSAGVFNKESITLIAGDITNQYVDLDHPIKAFSLDLVVSGVYMEETVDYTISLIGGVGGVTRLTFAGDLATGGASELIAGDKLVIKYQY